MRGELDTLVSTLPWGSFLIVEGSPDVFGESAPYAQGAPGPAGWYVEVVSEYYLPADDLHPIDTRWLTGLGFGPPDGETQNWWRIGVTASDVPGLLIAGLRVGRGCVDGSAVLVRTGRFPDRPRGGEPLPVLADVSVLVA